jgi:3'-phosphoadenosine 5'-phosphosulfate (PAPS) 3'-phosphatase
VTVFRRAAAFVVALALCAGNVAVCAGWQATPEARLACCMDGATCPMHKSDHHEHSSRHVVSQAQADSCCAAAAQRRDSSAAGSTFVASGAIALVPVAAMISTPTTASPEQGGRALVPLPVSSTPKHLLLSVLLV